MSTLAKFTHEREQFLASAAISELIHISGAPVTNLLAPEGTLAIGSCRFVVALLHQAIKSGKRPHACSAQIVGHVYGNCLSCRATEVPEDAGGRGAGSLDVEVKQLLTNSLGSAAANLDEAIIVATGIVDFSAGI